MKGLALFDIPNKVLNILGLKLFSNGNDKCVNLIFRVIYLIALLSQLVHGIYTIFRAKLDVSSLINNFSYMYLYVNCFYTYFRFIKYNKLIKAIIITALSAISKSQHAAVSRANRKFLILLTSFTALFLINIITFLIITPVRAQLEFQLGIAGVEQIHAGHAIFSAMFNVAYVLAAPVYLMVSCLMYVCVLHLLVLVEEAFAHDCIVQLVADGKSGKVCAVRNVMRQYLAVCHLRAMFHEFFDIYPFVWFSFLFLKSTANMMFLYKLKNELITTIIVESTDFILYFIAFFCAVHYADRLITKHSNLRVNIIAQLRLEFYKCSKPLVALIGERHFTLTACAMFNIDRSLIISFSGSLITFSILFAGMSIGAPA